MVTRQLYVMNHCVKNDFSPNDKIYLSKVRKIELNEKIESYFSKHPLLFWAIAFVGMPIGILLAVGIIATIWGLVILGIMSLI